jgi:hypothetical protein
VVVKRALGVVVAIAIAVWGLAALPAGAGPGSGIILGEVSATPSTGLVDGQFVQVHGSGFVPSGNIQQVTVAMCPADILNNPTNAGNVCGATFAYPLGVAPDGTFDTSLQVFRSQPTFPGTGTLNCLAPPGCAVFAIQVVIVGGILIGAVVAATPVSFRPLTVRDCIRGGWRSLTDARGRPFRSELACVLFALTQPRRAPVRPPRSVGPAPAHVFGRV